MKVKGQQRSNVVDYVIWLPNLVRRTAGCNLRMMMIFMEVKGQQRLNVVNYAMWLPNFAKRTADASLR